ncbi:unnamed protein product [Protopolystoma xenopodis]|uniref:Uncharacterized protein n=1 Tax=Protopolystoma xenopodis TaxID=117903 RepID=A0A3S5AQ19_9PLAT|nr:unnamed protein product [Protopolystoma xenopodis]
MPAKLLGMYHVYGATLQMIMHTMDSGLALPGVIWFTFVSIRCGKRSTSDTHTQKVNSSISRSPGGVFCLFSYRPHFTRPLFVPHRCGVSVLPTSPTSPIIPTHLQTWRQNGCDYSRLCLLHRQLLPPSPVM